MSIINLSLYAGVALVISLLSGNKIIDYLRQLKFGQSIREDGPQGHLKKAGTPTMGGFIILTGFVGACLAAFFAGPIFKSPDILTDKSFWIVLVSTLGFGLVGFLDDYIKVVKKRNLGLRAWQKIVGQVIVSTIIILMILPDGTDLWVPFGNFYWHGPALLIIPFWLIGQIFITNSVNLTDGLDGLAGGVTAIVMGFFSMAAIKLTMMGAGVCSLGLLGGCLGFLWFNKYPARVFMGDTGSLALGGAVSGLALALKLPLILPLVGLIYISEALSVVLQVGSFKLRGKRIFKMAPLHHHFELCGWKETKVVAVFWTITLGMALLSWFAL